jgi:signal peptidase II
VSRRPPLAAFLSVSALLVLVDQITKYAVVASLFLNESRPIVSGFLSLTYFRNRGGAFSLLADLPPFWGRTFFIVATLAALVFVFYLHRYNPPATRWGRFGLTLIFGGGLGNLIDRVVHGEVIDFILFYYGDFYWPAFNVADSCISVGVALLAVDIFVNPYGEPEADEPAAGGPGRDVPGGEPTEGRGSD